MAEKTITFTQDVKYDSIPPVYYKAGQKETLREDIAERWLKRGVATEDDGGGKKPKNAGAGEDTKPPLAAIDIPASWRTMLAADKIDLAKKLGAKDEDVTTGIAASDFIDAEVKKRADADDKA